MEEGTRERRDAKQKAFTELQRHKQLTLQQLQEEWDREVALQEAREKHLSQETQEAQADWEVARQAKEAAEFRLAQMIQIYKDVQRQLDEAVSKASLSPFQYTRALQHGRRADMQILTLPLTYRRLTGPCVEYPLFMCTNGLSGMDHPLIQLAVHEGREEHQSTALPRLNAQAFQAGVMERRSAPTCSPKSV
eukprot:scaffold4518_cov410-Prasinococcus_capsulatus_cf.AAC.38